MNYINKFKPIFGNNLSEAWAHAFVKSFNSTGGVLSPGIVSFPVEEGRNTWMLETPEIRQALETQLDIFDIRSANQSNIETVAGTIFPETIWKRCNGNRNKLFETYGEIWPQVKKCSANDRGTYFHRLTAFGEERINQLKFIIDAWEKGVHRHSALQAGIFDPSQDHRPTPFLGFPCLQQVVFHPIGPKGSGGMTVVAFYANQLLLQKAYGNYLGLFRLGKFMAGEMGMTLRGITCIASDLKMSYNHGKSDCASLVMKLRKELPDAN